MIKLTNEWLDLLDADLSLGAGWVTEKKLQDARDTITALRRVVEVAREVYTSIPATYDTTDPMVIHHAHALIALGDALRYYVYQEKDVEPCTQEKKQ